jgi:uncharacterized membrane protein YfhO
LTVQAATPCVLVLSELYYPGWRATVNGLHANVLRANGTLRGVVVPGGDSRLVFSYQPASLYGGAAISGLTLLAATLWLCFGRRNRSRT